MKFAHVPTVAAAVTIIAGCSFNPIGESKFDCNRKENPSEYCRSFKALERSTSGPLPESRFDKEFKMSDYDRATGIAPETAGPAPHSGAPVAVSLLPHQQLNPRSELAAGMPVRNAPVVQRVYIKRFVDENDNLQEGAIVYREIKAPRWAGFDGANQDKQMPGVYPHRTRNTTAVTAETDEPSPQQTNLAQPDSGTAGTAGSAMPPAGSGGFNASKAER